MQKNSGIHLLSYQGIVRLTLLSAIYLSKQHCLLRKKKWKKKINSLFDKEILIVESFVSVRQFVTYLYKAFFSSDRDKIQIQQDMFKIRK